jgi:hypothetical protein
MLQKLTFLEKWNSTKYNTAVSMMQQNFSKICQATHFAETLNCILKEIQNFTVQNFNGGEEAVTSLCAIFKKDKMIM